MLGHHRRGNLSLRAVRVSNPLRFSAPDLQWICTASKHCVFANRLAPNFLKKK